MRPFILIAAILSLTVGCKLPPLSNNYRTAIVPLESEKWATFAGSGAIAFNKAVTDDFRLLYSSLGGSKLYLVRSDGKKGRLVTCYGNADGCKMTESKFSKTRRDCAKGTNLHCRVFAIGDKIVWNGEVTYSNQAVTADMSFVNAADFLTMMPRKKSSMSVEESKYVGVGEIELNGWQTNVLVDYLRSKTPGFLIYPEKGTDATVYDCLKGAGTCSINAQVLDIISRCNNPLKGGNCFIFAKGREIVWNGPVRFKKSPIAKKNKSVKAPPPKGPPTKTFRRIPIKGMPDQTVCNYALSGGSTDKAIWTRNPIYRDLIQEAKDRGFSPEECLDKIFGS